MKTFFKVLVVALLATTAGLAGQTHTAISKDIETGNFLLAQVQVKADEAQVPVALPELADVFLKGGESSSGRVTAIDSQGQTLSIQRNGKSASIPLSKIESVKFKDGVKVYRSDGRQIIRGERDRPVGSQATWSGIGLNTFLVQNASQGQAVVRLGPPGVPKAKLRAILAVASDRQYVVDEMQFDLQQKTMTIRATPY